MKLKKATQLAIIGVILQLIFFIILAINAMGILNYAVWSKYFYVINAISAIGTALLLPFFVTLYKSQK